MAQALYYSPRLERPLIAALYHAAKAKRIPMTQLASLLVREGLERLGKGDVDERCVVSEETPLVVDPHGR